MNRFLFIVLCFSLCLAQEIRWTGLEGGFIELINTNFENSQAATYFRPSAGQQVRRLTCGSEGQSISPSGPRGTLTWSMSGVPTYTEIYVKIRFGFIDSWEDEEAYITVNGVDIWRKKSTTDQGNHNIQVCGRTTRTDELITIERRLRVSAPATTISIVIGSNLDQDVDNEFFEISEFVVYIHGGKGAPAPTVGTPTSNQGQWETIYQSNFQAGIPSNWVDQANAPVNPIACGSEGITLRQGGPNNYIQWKSSQITYPFTRVRVTARIGFLDSWDGEAAWIQVNGNELWRQTSTAPAANADAATIQQSGHTSQVCGDGSRPPRSNDRFENVVREIDVPSPTDGIVTVRVGSGLDQDIDNESFVVGNMRVDVLRQ